MNVTCSAQGCPIILNSLCVIYEGESLLYTGVTTNDTLETALQKIDAKFHDAGLGYIFTNGLSQTVGQPVKLGGSLIENTTITNNSFYLQFTGTVKAASFVTTSGTSSQFVKGDGSLDSQSYQLAGSYITALSGDAYAIGPGNANITLATVNGSVGTFGTATNVPTITVNEKGLVTNVTSTAISIPWPLLVYIGDVTGIGYPGTQVTLTLNSVNSTVINSNKIVKLTVNDKGLITSAIPANDLDIFNVIGYTPLNPTRTISINGVPQDLSVNRTWSVGTVTNVSATAGASIGVSVTDPTGAPNITITNLAPDRIVSITGGTGISVTGTYPNFTIINTGGSGGGGGTGTVTSVGLTMPSAFAVANSPITGGGVLTVTALGNSGQYIDGLGALQTFPSISGISGFPSQATNGGKYLTTNGSVLSWATISQALSTLTDVSFPIALAQGQIITYNATSSKWENNTIGNALGYTPANNASVVHTTGNETVGGTKTFTSGIIETAGDNTFNTTSGNTFIGYSAPVGGGYKLDVSGTTRITGQLTLSGYTSTSVFTGTAVGYLAFDASGNIITSAGSGGGSSITLTTTGSSGAATLISNVLNIPNYTLAGLGGVSGSGTAGQVTYWSGTSAVTGSANFTWDGNNIILGNSKGITLSYAGTNRTTNIYPTNIADNFSGLAFYPSVGTNVGQAFQVIPRGTGYSSTIKAQFTVANTDLVADSTNFETMVVRAAGTAFTIASGKGGTGTIRPILLSAGFTDGTTNSNQFWLYSSNNIGINTSSDSNYRLDINGTGATAGILRATGSITAATNLATGVVFTPTLVASANNDVLVGLDVNPTFTNGAFTGVSNIGVRTNANIYINRNDTKTTSSLYIINSSTTGTNNIMLGEDTSTKNLGFGWFPSGSTTYRSLVANTAYMYVLGGGAQLSFNTTTATQPITFSTNDWNEKMRIWGNGNVLIGGGNAPTDALSIFGVKGSVTAASLIARGVYFNNTLVAAANNDVLVGLDITPTFTNGAFTGVTNLALRTTAGNVQFGGSTGFNWDNTNNRLGIGTATPANVIDVTKSVAGDNGIFITNTSTNSIAQASVNVKNDSGTIGSFKAYSSTFSVASLQNITGFGSSNSIALFTDSAVASGGSGSIRFHVGGYDAVSERARFTTTGLGIGTSTPSGLMEISGATGVNSFATIYSSDAIGAGFFGRKARGTSASPTAPLSGDNILGFGGSGYVSGAFQSSKAAIFFDAAENWTATNNGTQIRFATTTNASTTRTDKLLISNSGNVLIQNGGTFTDGGQRLQVIGDTLILSGTSTGITTTTNVHTFPVSGIGSIHYNYHIQNTVNGGWRTGIVMAVTNGTNVEFTDTATADLTATTAGLTWSVSVVSTNIVLTATITSGTWNIKVGTRML